MLRRHLASLCPSHMQMQVCQTRLRCGRLAHITSHQNLTKFLQSEAKRSVLQNVMPGPVKVRPFKVTFPRGRSRMQGQIPISDPNPENLVQVSSCRLCMLHIRGMQNIYMAQACGSPPSPSERGGGVTMWDNTYKVVGV